MRRFLLPLAAFALLLPFAAPAEVQPPKVGEVQLVRPLPLPYDLNADSKRELDAALARAKKSGKRVIVDLGGNWCGDCRVFSAMVTSPQIKPFVDAHFEMVMVNVGRYDTNLDIPARFGIEKLGAAPTTLVVSPAGKLLNGDDLVALKDARAMTAQAVVDWLAHWAGPVKGRKV